MEKNRNKVKIEHDSSSQKPIAKESSKAQKNIIKKGIKDFKFGSVIGDGAYSTVMLATSIDTKKEVRRKSTKQRIFNTPEESQIRQHRKNRASKAQ